MLVEHHKQTQTIDRTYLLTAPLAELIQEARAIRQRYCGTSVDICSIMNAKSGACSEDCAFCAQSGYHKTAIQTYPLKSVAALVAAAEAACDNGAQRFGIVCSGNRPTPRELDMICEAARLITERCNIAVCTSLGKLTRDELRALKHAGVTRYHHNIETSRQFYPSIVTTHSFDDRIQTITDAAAAGLEVCSGVIIGLGETWDDRIDMALELNNLPIVSVPVNILIPIRGTRLEHQARVSAIDCIRCIALFRIILQDKVIKIAAGRETVLQDFQALGFSAGANGMLIGGYLTVKGRDVAADRTLIDEIKIMWANGL
ncbi:MAG: biotin synthase BioB [Desulfobacterota bacterium]|nr:biotin synthase BioB [Thermodesulfobacteriota bacterium]